MLWEQPPSYMHLFPNGQKYFFLIINILQNLNVTFVSGPDAILSKFRKRGKTIN